MIELSLILGFWWGDAPIAVRYSTNI